MWLSFKFITAMKKDNTKGFENIPASIVVRKGTSKGFLLKNEAMNNAKRFQSYPL